MLVPLFKYLSNQSCLCHFFEYFANQCICPCHSSSIFPSTSKQICFSNVCYNSWIDLPIDNYTSVSSSCESSIVIVFFIFVASAVTLVSLWSSSSVSVRVASIKLLTVTMASRFLYIRRIKKASVRCVLTVVFFFLCKAEVLVCQFYVILVVKE